MLTKRYGETMERHYSTSKTIDMSLRFIALLIALLLWLVVAYSALAWSIVVTYITALLYLSITLVSLLWIWSRGHFSKPVRFIMTVAQGCGLFWQMSQILVFVLNQGNLASADTATAVYCLGAQLFSWTGFASICYL